MALSRDVYRELEDIVGTENISEDPVVLDAYAFGGVMGAALVGPEARFNDIRAEAVVLPGSTEEVQKVIRLCNRRGLRSIAHSTGYGPMGAVSGENSIQLDMRRMNRILEIDEKNMYIVVEPYVSFAQVQAEAHKRGLNCHIIGAGSNCSFLASHTSHGGPNKMAISQGSSGRNMLGVEWVLPTGEVLRVGAPGSGAGWFSGDGPGPSLRGIIRGAGGADGGLGVFTKCASHLHPWPGPTEMEINGRSPAYETEVPPLFEYHILEWPSWERCADAQYKIGEAGIAFVLHKTGGPGSHGAIVTGSNNEYYEKSDLLRQLPEISWAIVTAAASPAEHAYQVKVLDKILEDTGGKFSPIGEEPIFRKRDFINMIRACFIPRLAFRMTGAFTVDGLVGMESIDNTSIGLKLDKAHRDRYAERRIIADDGTYNSWGVTWEAAHYGHFECGHLYNPISKESVEGAWEMVQKGSEINLSVPISVAGMLGGEGKDLLGPSMGNFPGWMRKIKKTFDPNTVSDPRNYISAEG